MSSTVAPAAIPSPMRIFKTLTAFQETAAMKAAIQLDLFSAIADGATDAPAIAARIEASEKGTRVLCDALSILGFLEKTDGHYALAPDAAFFLTRTSPAYLGRVTDFLVDETRRTGAFDDMAGVVRKGGTLYGEDGTVSRENPIWVTFARSMAPLMAMPAELLATRLAETGGTTDHVLDIAAGHGLYGLAFARHNPRARITAVDWPSVLQVARHNATEAGAADRYQTIEGSAFEVDFDGAYDVVLLTNFLHHFDVTTCEGLLRRLHAAMKPGARAAALEFVPNDDRVTPPGDAMFSLIMLATTAHGDAYTFADLAGMFARAGFSRSELIELAPLPQRVVVAYR